MTADRESLAQVADAVEALRQEVARLAARVAQMETALAGSQESEGRRQKAEGRRQESGALRTPNPKPAQSNLGDEAGLSEELLVVISAAIAAFLGKKPHIRQIRLLGSAAWAQQGRAMIQASHVLPVHHR